MSKVSSMKQKGFVRTTKHLEGIGRLIREIFIYGNKSRKDFENIGCDDRSFDEQRRRIEACIQDRFIDCNILPDKTKCWKFKVDLYHNSYNYLIEAYRIKTITANLFWELIFMQIFATANIPLSKNDIFSMFDIDNKIMHDKIKTFIDYPDVNVVNRSLNHLLSYGWISEIRDTKPYRYQISKSIFDALSFDEIKELYLAITFYKNVSFLTVPGYYLEKTLYDYCTQKFNKTLVDEELFQYRFSNYAKILDDRTNYIIQEAIVQQKKVTIVKYDNDLEVIVTPISVSITYPYNKQQLNTKEGIYVNLDSIKSIKIAASTTSRSKKEVTLNKLHRLELCFTFLPTDDKNEVIHIKNRLKQEASWMELIENTEDKLVYTALVNDSRKYVPWIRTFHKYVSFTENTHHYLVKWVKNDREEMLKNYGIIF